MHALVIEWAVNPGGAVGEQRRARETI